MTEPLADASFPLSRRRALALTASTAFLGATAAARSQTPGPLIAGIHREKPFPGRAGSPAWFHPRACLIPTPDGPTAVMTMQTIHGSDVFGPVHATLSRDGGRTWTPPEPITGLGREAAADGLESGVCDVVPEYHAATQTVLAMGHDVYYRDNVLAKPQPSRRPVYVVRSADGSWSPPQHLEWDDPRGSMIYSCGCSQRLVMPDGDVLVPLTYGTADRTDRQVTSALCSFDGRTLRIRRVGAGLVNRAGRGLLEPSLARWNDRFYITIRAEDGRGYVSTSDDGLAWEPHRPWAWDDGEPIEMSTTQQHWMVHSDALFLVYTRKTAENARVVRWRAPLFMAEVDRSTLRLIRATEQAVLPLVGDPAAAPQLVPLMGNFHVTTASPMESWVTVGENRPKEQWWGDVRLARVQWARPNRTAII